jgi:two-component system cell cycle sensor histidine kinase/response regulator CckA
MARRGGERLERELDLHRAELTAQTEELARANADIAAVRDRYALLFDAAPTGCFVLDGEGRIVEANRAAKDLVGLERRALMGLAFEQLVAPNERGVVRARLDRAQGSFSTVIWAAMRMIAVRVQAAPLGEHRLLCVTEERSGPDRVQRLEMLGQVASGVAHDVNNMLGVVLSSADAALATLGEDDQAREPLVAMKTAAEHAAALGRQVIAYASGARMEPASIHIGDVMRSIDMLLRAMLGKNVTLSLSLGAGVPPIHGDAVRIRQIVVNLVHNAAEALGDRGGEIVLATRVQDGKAVLDVGDDGPGMDEETRAHALEPFYSTKVDGRGLGLSIVQESARALRGTVSIASSLGKGTKVSVAFPASGEPPRESIAPSSSTQLRWHGAGRVLVVDDEPRVRRATAMILRTIGFDAVEIESGEQALVAVRGSTDLAAVIVDLTMPGIDGRATLEAVKRIRPDLPVIVTSGWPDADRDRDLVNAADALLAKPYGMNALAETMERVLNERD